MRRNWLDLVCAAAIVAGLIWVASMVGWIGEETPVVRAEYIE